MRVVRRAALLFMQVVEGGATTATATADPWPTHRHVLNLQPFCVSLTLIFRDGNVLEDSRDCE